LITTLPKPPKSCHFDRLESLKLRHTTLKQKSTSLLELLYDLSQPRLTPSEIKWFGDLQSLYHKYIHSYTPDLGYVKSIERAESSEGFKEVLGMRQVRDLKRGLEEEARELRNVGKRVEGLVVRVDGLTRV
jgi:hypothetical protein